MPNDRDRGRPDGQSFPIYDPATNPSAPYIPDRDYAQTRVGMGGDTAIVTTDAPAPPRRRGISRRAALIGAGVGAVGLGAAGAGLGAVLLKQHTTAPNILTTDTSKINHLLRRAGFGPTPSEIGTYLSLGLQGSIDRLLSYGSVSDDLESRLATLTFDESNPSDVVRRFILRMIYSKRPLEEKMTLFWHGVLTSSIRDVGGKARYSYMTTQNNLLRSKAFGRFDDLVYAITIDPAMLWYLNGRQSTGKSPNENYARELMELFTLGISDASGKDNYTQDDVHQGALALTGWTDRGGGDQGVLISKNAYGGSVTFLGQTETFGVKDIVRIVCAHPSTGRHLAFRMWSFFVYENPSDADLKPLIDAYYQHDHNIGAVVRAMLTAPAFFSDKAYRGRIKSPVEFVVGAIRGLGLEVDGKGLPEIISAMGQTVYDPPNVSGWDGDKISANWLSTQTWMQRVNYINRVVAAAAGGAGGGVKVTSATPPLQQLITTYQLHTAQDVAAYFEAALVDSHLDADRRAVVQDAVAQAAATGASLTLASGATLSAAAARQMLYLLMSMPEYQMN